MTLSEYSDLTVFERIPAKKKYLRYYLLGIIDSEGCFCVSMKRQESSKFGWVLDPVFHVTQHESNEVILELLQREMRCGRVIVKHGSPELKKFIVDNRRQIAEILIPYFWRYRLITKWDDFQKFAEITEALEQGDHRDREKLINLVRKAYSMNMNGKQRRRKLEEIVEDIESAGTSETIRQTSDSG
jgi:Cft2 family RNA processing exonuclease